MDFGGGGGVCECSLTPIKKERGGGEALAMHKGRGHKNSYKGA